MRIVHITHTPTAGAPHNFVNLINKYTKNEAYLFIEKDLVFNFYVEPKFRIDKNRKKDIIPILKKTDIIHFHGHKNFDLRKFLGYNIRPYMKKVVLHYHGVPHIGQGKRFFRNVPMLVCIPDMLLDFPKALFFPNIIDDNNLQLYCKKKEWNEPLKFAQHFTFHKVIKQQDLFINTAKFFNKNSFTIIPSLNHKEALQERLKYDIIFDHIRGHYGIISLECLLQGIPVINFTSKIVEQHLIKFFGYMPPFINVENKDLKKTIQTIIDNKDILKSIAETGQYFVKKYWGHENIHRLIKYYELL